MLRRACTCWLGLLVMLTAIGCAAKGSSPNERINRWLATRDLELPPPVYQVQPPDVLVIVAPQIRELDGQEQTVRPDGRISLNVIGEVMVAGKTPDEIGDDLRRLASRYYDERLLDISVQVAEFNSKSIYIFGQVHQPGIKQYTGRDTIVNVLADARLNDRAWPQRIIVVRPHEQPDLRQKVTVDLKQMYQKGEVWQNILLEPGDVVYVPPSPLAQLEATFTKLLIPIRPVVVVTQVATLGI